MHPYPPDGVLLTNSSTISIEVIENVRYTCMEQHKTNVQNSENIIGQFISVCNVSMYFTSALGQTFREICTRVFKYNCLINQSMTVHHQ